MPALEPCDKLEKTIRIVHACFGYAGVPYWLAFGGLYAVVKNRGIIPDGDLDLCTYYGQDYTRLEKVLKGRGYEMSKCLVDDTDHSKALYCGFNHPEYVHLCVSFWYPHGDKRYFMHDEKGEMHHVGVPSGYWFKGVPAALVDDELFFRHVEWPGIDGSFKIRVPMLAGSIMDCIYPFWAYQHQKYNVDTRHTVEDEKLGSVYHGGATSRYRVHVKSMADWNNAAHVQDELETSEAKWRAEVKRWQKSFK